MFMKNSEKYEILKQSISALVALKEKNLSHLDIKPVNILVKNLNQGYEIKLSDFGTSR